MTTEERKADLARRFIEAEPHVRRLAGLTIGLEQFIEPLKESGDELFMALADMIDVLGGETRAAQAAMQG